MKFLKGGFFTVLVLITILLAFFPRFPSILPQLWTTRTEFFPTTITYVTMSVATHCYFRSYTLSYVYLETTTVVLKDPANLDLTNIALVLFCTMLLIIASNWFWCAFVDHWTPAMIERAKRARYGDLDGVGCSSGHCSSGDCDNYIRGGMGNMEGK